MASFLEQAIAEQNVRKIRSALGSYIMSEPTDRKKEVSSAVSRLRQQGVHIWEEHDGRELVADQSNWTKDYFTTLQAELTSNFSKERFEHTLQVGKHAYKEELARPIQEPVRVRPDTAHRTAQMRGTSSGKLLAAGLVVIAAAATIYLVMRNQ